MVPQTPPADDPREIIALLRDRKGWSYERIGREMAAVLDDPAAAKNRTTLQRIAKGENDPSARTRRGLIALRQHHFPDLPQGFGEPAVEAVEGELPKSTPNLAPGHNVWQVKSRDFASFGFIPGDYFILDQTPGQRRDGDYLVVNIIDEAAASASTAIRVLKRDFLLPPNPATEEMIHKDHRNVGIHGVIIRRWWERR